MPWEDEEIEPTIDGSAGARGARRRYRSTLAAVLVAVLAAGTASVRAWRDDGTADVDAASAPTPEPTVTTITVAPPTTTTEPLPPPSPGRRRLLADRARGWELLLVDADRCLELVVGPWKQASLLCDAAPATDLLGDLVALDTPVGRMAVAVVAPSVSSLGPIVGMPGRVGPDPDRPAVAYGAAEVGTGGTGFLPDVVVEEGPHTLARFILPAKTGPISRSELTAVTTPPYGRWPGYRKAGYTGLFFGGNQVLGFYDGDGDGKPCVLYRRFGNAHEGVIADACPAQDRARPLAFARLVPVPMETPEPAYVFVAAADRPVSAWRCERPTGEPCGGSEQVFRDPNGSGRVVLGQFAAWVTPGPHDRIVVVLTVDGQEQRVDVPVPR